MEKERLLHKLKPVHRVVAGLLGSIVVYFLISTNFDPLVKLLLCWSFFALIYIIISWVIFYTMPAHQIKRRAAMEDGSIGYVLAIIVLACVGSFFAVFFIIVSDGHQPLSKLEILPITIFGMLVSWWLVHTVFTFHYARLFYMLQKKGLPALEFPEGGEPDYLDFAYFSFVLGCTFQVSDITIQNKEMRRVVLFHGLLSFALNTFVIALSINLISGVVH